MARDKGAPEDTFVMLKPDAVERGLIGEIVGRLERKGLKLVRIKLMRIEPELARRHYAHLVDRDFYPSIEAYVTRGPVVAMIWNGRQAIAAVRKLLGATDGANAEPGTIRGDFSVDPEENLVHASDSAESAAREIANFFPEI